MTNSNFRDPQHLKTQQYASADNLRTRVALHERFSTNRQDFHRWVFEQLELPAAAEVLELGTGPAKLWQQNAERLPAGWSLTLTDLSPGMVAEAKAATEGLRERVGYTEVNAEAIPFAAERFDAVIANHMLYHVPNLDKALAEIRRVLKPGGALYAATNGERHMEEMETLIAEQVRALFPEATFERAKALGFRLENGADLLSPFFGTVELTLFPNNALELTETEPLLAYILSMSRLQDATAGLKDDALKTLSDSLRREIDRRLERGPIHITKASGLFVAR